MSESYVYKNYRICQASGLERAHVDEVLNIISSDLPKNDETKVLGGRGKVYYGTLSDVGSVVVKPYLRGGLFSLLISDRYVNIGQSRSEKEYAILSEVRERSILAPQPLIALTSKGLFYKSWLVMRDISEKANLAVISEKEPELLPGLLTQLCRYVSLLIDCGVCHIDLHPGNVILSHDEGLYIIDFDKAYYYKGTKNKLRDYYLCRWRRAVIKHGLTDELSEYFCMGLRKNFNEGLYSERKASL